MEKIIKIEEVVDIGAPGDQRARGFDGWKVATTSTDYLILISNGQDCCEDAGYISSAESPREFEGAELFSVSIVDEALNGRVLDREKRLDEGGMIFVNFDTDRGRLQLAVYNAHNGYYGHRAKVYQGPLPMAERVL